MEIDRRKTLQLVGLLLLLILPFGILLAFAHEANPAIPTIPGIQYAYREGVEIDGQVVITYDDSSTKLLALKPLAFYDVSGKVVSSISVNTHTITVSIDTQDPTALCEVTIEWKMSWSASASGTAKTEENTFGMAKRLTLGTPTGYNKVGSLTTKSYTVSPSACFPASPSQGQASSWNHLVEVTATFRYTAGLGVLPGSFTRTAGREASVSLTWKTDYTYGGSATVSGTETTVTGGATDGYTGGGGCPYLYVYNGKCYEVLTFLNIHSGEGVDIEDQRWVPSFVDEKGCMRLMLMEEPTGNSYIDKVEVEGASLVSAWHRNLGDVTFLLAEDDEARVHTSPDEEIYLTFKVNRESGHFLFKVQGYNFKAMSLLPMRPLQAFSEARKTLMIDWTYIILEVVGLVLISVPYIPGVKEKLGE